MSKKKRFKVGDEVTDKREGSSSSQIFRVVLTAKLAGERVCGIVGGYVNSERALEEYEVFVSQMERGSTYHLQIVPETSLQPYREPIYAVMTRGQFDRVITAAQGGPALPEGDTAIDLRDLEKI